MRNAPFAEPLVPADTKDEAAIAARRRLQVVLDQLNPAGGIFFRGADQVGNDAAKTKAKKAGKRDSNGEKNPGNAYERDQRSLPEDRVVQRIPT
jgi:hypothetical protein